jgi:lipoate-protein ligase A
MKFAETHSTDAYTNMAYEEAAFTLFPQDESYLLLWQNRNTVVVGRHQNTAAEINADVLREHGIQVVRRLTGGGAVYHDMGNLNFTLIGDARPGGLDFASFTRPVVTALRKLGINAELSGRNDLTVGGRKVSGNAQLVRHGRVLHHGTLLFESRLDILAGALRPPEGKLQSHAVPSVVSRVTNIPVGMDAFREALLDELFPSGVERYEPSAEVLAQISQLREEKYATWDWNYGQSPAYTQRDKRRFPFGEVELWLDIREGRIAGAKLYGDFFTTADVEALERSLLGKRPESASWPHMEAALGGI